MKEKSCSNCGALFLTDQLIEFDGLTLCDDCFQNYSSNRVIKDYYYKPTPIFYGKGGRFFGVELGKRFGTKFSNKASVFGGAILILIGIEIFLTGIIG